MFQRTKKQREDDFRIIAKYREKGYTFAQITEYLNRIRPYKVDTVANYKLYQHRIKKAVATEADTTEEKERMLYDIEAIMIKALREFERSSDDKTIITETGDVVEGSNKMVGVKRTISTIPREGNPKYLELYLKTLVTKAKLLGLLTPSGAEAESEENNLLQKLFLGVSRNIPITPRIMSEREMMDLDEEEAFGS